MKKAHYTTAMLFVMFVSMGAPCAAQKTTSVAAKQIAWRGWSEKNFSDAKLEHRFVLLDLEAVWCHWCHVMDVNTYSDAKVIRLLQAHYITVKVDQDSRPDLSNRYQDYGWPATVVFDADSHEIVKRQGYLSPDEMASMLQAIIDDPSPGPSVQPAPELEIPENAILSSTVQKQLTRNYFSGYDSKNGSWGTDQKFLDWDSVEYSIVLARRNGDKQAEHMARQTFDEQLHLLDPAWGGVYQYSTDGDWNSPHFEKIMQMQAENLRIYSLAYAQFREPAYLHAAQEIRRYLKTFLTSPDGAFYTSQDADLIEGKHSADYFALNDAQGGGWAFREWISTCTPAKTAGRLTRWLLFMRLPVIKPRLRTLSARRIGFCSIDRFPAEGLATVHRPRTERTWAIPSQWNVHFFRCTALPPKNNGLSMLKRL